MDKNINKFYELLDQFHDCDILSCDYDNGLLKIVIGTPWGELIYNNDFDSTIIIIVKSSYFECFKDKCSKSINKKKYFKKHDVSFLSTEFNKKDNENNIVNIIASATKDIINIRFNFESFKIIDIKEKELNVNEMINLGIEYKKQF